jgi:hypothetical protein
MRLLTQISILLGLRAVRALQFCNVDPQYKTDLCFAVRSSTNITTGREDLSLHLSAKFEDRIGWAAVGIGEEMGGALMFVLYPGAEVGGM